VVVNLNRLKPMDANQQTGIDEAIQIAGSQTALAQLLGLTPQAVQKWVAQGFVPAERCRSVEDALEHRVSRYRLNPDVFGSGDEPNTQKINRSHPTEEQLRETADAGGRQVSVKEGA
jgi:DNA-binding transcriptional regulator YdaS (Cro superfamily)